MASKFAAVMLAVLLAGCAPAGSAKQNSASAACADGELALLRVSRIPEGGSLAGFMGAVQAQTAWYRSHGFTENEQVVGHVLIQENGTWTQSASEIVTIHRRPPDNSAIEQDTEWAAFVAQFQANSVIETERWICVSS
jgi:hypothetical protein